MVSSWQPTSSESSVHDFFAPSLSINALNMVDLGVKNIEEALSSRGGQTVFKYGGMSNGVGQLVTDVKGVARPGSVRVLRIWSHGGPGFQQVSSMSGVRPKGQRAGIAFSNWDQVAPSLGQLKPYFELGGRLELRGCSVGVGLSGEDFLLALARLLNVEVFAALNPQPIGPIEWAGPVVSIAPNGSRAVTSGKPI